MGTVFALANILTQLGFSVIAVILGGSLLHSVNDKCEAYMHLNHLPSDSLSQSHS